MSLIGDCRICRSVLDARHRIRADADDVAGDGRFTSSAARPPSTCRERISSARSISRAPRRHRYNAGDLAGARTAPDWPRSSGVQRAGDAQRIFAWLEQHADACWHAMRKSSRRRIYRLLPAKNRHRVFTTKLNKASCALLNFGHTFRPPTGKHHEFAHCCTARPSPSACCRPRAFRRNCSAQVPPTPTGCKRCSRAVVADVDSTRSRPATPARS